jgi:glycosyltransferase involved in cell wall biosynthesis
MKVALVHEWLTNLAGSERVLLAFTKLFPGAPVYTATYRPQRLPFEFRRLDVRTTFADRLPLPHQALLPLLPYAFESLDLREYDLVLTSSHACAKGVLTRADALHVAYCHTPMRYAWDLHHDYQAALPRAARPASAWLLHRLRLWDLAASARVDRFIANSHTVAQRIAKWYRRPATVINPPIQVSRFSIGQPGERFLLVSRLVPYKRIDLAIAAFNRLGLPLDIIGRGPEYRRLARQAGRHIRFLGHVPDEEVARALSAARAVIFPSQEDFGLVPLEAMASGRPVVALRRGGAVETVVEGLTGTFFDEPAPEALIDAVARAVRTDWDPAAIRRHAAQYDESIFLARMRAYLDRALAERAAGVPGISEPDQAEALADSLERIVPDAGVPR